LACAERGLGEGLTAELIWQRRMAYYPVEAGHFFLGLSPDGRRVVSAADLRSFGGHRELDAINGGAFLESRMTAIARDRDRAWRRELREGKMVDLSSGATLLERPADKLSGDGRHAFGFGCAGDRSPPSALRWQVDSGAVTEVGATPPGTCVQEDHLTAAVTNAGDHAIFARGVDARLHHADFTAGTVSSIDAHRPDPGSAGDPLWRANAGSVISVALSPTDRWAATIGADRTLRIWSFPGLQPVLPDIPVRWANAYLNCYCASIAFAPVAWSPDETLLATPDSNGNAVVRRACDGVILMTLERPDPPPEWSIPQELGPSLFSFGPDGRELVVAYENEIVYYRLR
jgi:WD40 repeat protein